MKLVKLIIVTEPGPKIITQNRNEMEFLIAYSGLRGFSAPAVLWSLVWLSLLVAFPRANQLQPILTNCLISSPLICLWSSRNMIFHPLRFNSVVRLHLWALRFLERASAGMHAPVHSKIAFLASKLSGFKITFLKCLQAEGLSIWGLNVTLLKYWMQRFIYIYLYLNCV